MDITGLVYRHTVKTTHHTNIQIPNKSSEELNMADEEEATLIMCGLFLTDKKIKLMRSPVSTRLPGEPW